MSESKHNLPSRAQEPSGPSGPEGAGAVWLMGSPTWISDAESLLVSWGGRVHRLEITQVPDLADPDAPRFWTEVWERIAPQKGPGTAWVMPGDSLWADRPDWQRMVREAGFVPLVPPASALHRSSNRLTFLLAAEALGVPTLLAHDDPFASAAEAWTWLQNQGQGKSQAWVLKSVSQLEEGFGVFPVTELTGGTRREIELWFRQVQERSGQHLVFVETHREAARLVDVGFIRSSQGVWIAPWVDSTLRVKGRRWILTCPAREQEESGVAAGVAEAVERLAINLGWQGWGQARFLVEGGEFYLLDLTARMFASDRLAEAVSGRSFLQQQFEAIGGEVFPWSPDPVRTSFAAAVAVSAENPVTGVPQPGVAWRLPSETRAVETLEEGSLLLELKLGLAVGERLSPEGDGLIAWVRATGPSRNPVLQALRGFLRGCVFAGSFHANDAEASLLLTHPWVREDCVHADFLDQDYLPRSSIDSETLRQWARALDQFSKAKGLPLPAEGWVIADRRVPREGQEQDPLALSSDGLESEPVIVPLGNGAFRVREGHGTALARPAAARGGTAQIRALCAGRVQALFYREGGEAPAHESVVVLESLARLVPHASPRALRVLKWHVRAEQEVEAWDLLAEVELLPLSQG